MRCLQLLGLFIIVNSSCNGPSEQLVQVEGEAQGTTYHISYTSTDKTNLKPAIDLLLRKIDTSMSTYLPVSIICRMNRNDTSARADQFFTTVFNKSMEVGKATGGLFDVTVAPLVNAWGFGPKAKSSIDSVLIDSLHALVGYGMLQLQDGKLVKEKPGIQLDFNALAQGYSVDVIGAMLAERGITNYLVELGGELRARGTKFGNSWKVGIDQPDSSMTEGRKLEAVIKLNDRALATSGGYRKFFTENGQRYTHIIDPRTGYPVKQTLLSATVLAQDAITADAYATAFLVMGLDASTRFIGDHPELYLDAFFIYDNAGEWKTFSTKNIQKLIKLTND